MFREKVLLKYTDDGKLEVILVGLNGTALDPTSGYYKPDVLDNVDWDLVIIGYSEGADSLIKSLDLEVGDIIEIDAEKDVYDPDNWSPDHEVNVKAYITYVE